MDRYVKKKFKLVCFQDKESIYCVPYDDVIQNITDYMFVTNNPDFYDKEFIPVMSLELLKLRYVDSFILHVMSILSCLISLLMSVSILISLYLDFVYKNKISFMFLFLLCFINLILYLFYNPKRIIDVDGKYINLKTGENNIGDGRLIINTHFPNDNFM